MEDAKVDLVVRLKNRWQPSPPGELRWGEEGMLRKLSMEDLQNRGCKGLLCPLGAQQVKSRWGVAAQPFFELWG